ncbi:hypothetical protein BDP81DRAFT_395759 [Colletotrichum phormii]|uniref:Uncharacterized protein n=1 Tax=Colletotrichum phormii TaxID=359342 RepID=A0AAI9ZR62_9PEZI|nr:uncharacterized protein BDP81DRAFT_395759 [Colletotrichum phormii]KAK1635309.1 hypothetical protein BDP81DRAFT_395759 [Colletotrichum phormii]
MGNEVQEAQAHIEVLKDEIDKLKRQIKDFKQLLDQMVTKKFELVIVLQQAKVEHGNEKARLKKDYNNAMNQNTAIMT